MSRAAPFGETAGPAPGRKRAPQARLKRLCILIVCLPGLFLAWRWLFGGRLDGWGGPALGAQPVTTLIHETGLWAVRLLLATLAVTPLRFVSGWTRAVVLRRPLGVAACCYAVAHLSLYVVQQNFRLGHVMLEIVLRIYLLIGFTALLGLAALAVTSTDGWVRRLGRDWKRLHRLVFVVAPLALLHFFMQSKLDVAAATTYAGFFAWLALWRLLPRRLSARIGGVVLLLPLAVAVTLLVEYLWFAIATRIDPLRILRAELVWRLFPRPASRVLLAAAAVLLVDGLHRVAAAGGASKPGLGGAGRAN